jgi:serine/threonine protein kinase/Tol biopolymer transport system component
MSSEREQRITSIFHSAIEREGTERRAFLDGACGNDAELRREVESLIRSHEQAGSLMDAPAYERDASLVGEMDQGNFVGRTLAHYRIVRRLGGGGMGEVFLAEDTQLGRRVAVKILPHRLTSDPSLVARFRQEARAASALNHANIVTIYEVGESEGTHFIATEYVEGVTLREHMSRSPLTVGEVLDIAAQIAAALSKAHGAGVVHRDIKPENVMVDDENHAKVLDFGIAKLVEQSTESANEAPTALKVETRPGAVMGTAHYMSPEQARALRDVDARTDVWSLGVVLYEMLAGRLPFEGETPSDVMVAILNKAPVSLARFNREVSEALELAVEKALAKNRDERYQTVKEMASDLRRIRQRFDSGASSPRFDDQTDASAAETRATSLMAAAAPGTDSARQDETAPIHTTSSAEYIVSELKRHKRGIVIALVALVVVGAGVAFALYKYAGREKPPIFQNYTVSRITTSGQAQDAAISPDGKYIVYLEMTDDGNRGLYVKQTATGNIIPIVPPTKGNVLRDTSFSPDGNFIYYRFYDRINPIALYRVSSVGGSSTKIIDPCHSAAAVSPDGRKIAFLRTGGLVVANVDGTGERLLASSDGNNWFQSEGPAWSPDGKTIAIAGVATVDGVDQFRLLGIDAESGAKRDLSPKRWVGAGRVVWMPDGAALALMATERTDEVGSQVWRVAYPSGEASRITNDVQVRDESSLGVTADGRTLVTVTEQVLSRIETVPAGGDVSRLTRLTSAEANGEGYEGFDLAPDGRVVFSSYEGGQFDLWVMKSDGSGRQRLTSDTHVEDDPTVSPDGRYIVFRSNRPDGAATMRLWRMDIDGGNPVQLAERAEFAAHISPDGKWVLYARYSVTEKFGSLWKVSVTGGEPVRVTDYPSGWDDSTYSPDGKWIGCYFRDEQLGDRYGIIPASGGRPIRHFQFPGFQYQSVHWTADSRYLSFIGAPPDPSNIWLQPAEGGEPRKLTDFKTDYIYGHAWSRDGKTLALARGRPAFDVVLLKDNR